MLKERRKDVQFPSLESTAADDREPLSKPMAIGSLQIIVLTPSIYMYAGGPRLENKY